MDELTLTLPRHAVRFLAQVCKAQRLRMVKALIDGMPSLQSEAAFDSLDCLESALPDDIWKDAE